MRDLRLHLRAWERHRIHFGIVCPQSRVTLCRDLFSATCATGWNGAAGETIPGVDGAVMLETNALVYRFPYRYQDPRCRGRVNRGFLDPAPVRVLLQKLPASVSTVVMTIPHIYRTEEMTFSMFARQLEQFLTGMPGGVNAGIELQTSRFLLPDYFELLARYGAIHVIGDSPSMPPPLEQIQLPLVLTAGRCIVRSAARTDPFWQLGMIEIVRRCVDEKRSLYLYLSDTEEAVEQSLIRLMELLRPDLAKLSPLRRRRAA
ncbi:MAG: hypothetical protein OEV30_00625 [Ignavibacteria bacterium]|nr:hypothetical protein [Ignavibacteria bacterium]